MFSDRPSPGYKDQTLQSALVLFYNEAIDKKIKHWFFEQGTFKEKKEAMLSLVFSLYIINIYLTQVAV